MFLGYSVLQLLEYWVSAIRTPLAAFQVVLSQKIAELRYGTQVTTLGHAEIGNDTDNYQLDDLGGEPMVRNCDTCEENFKVMEQQFREIKTRMKKYEMQRKISKMNSKIPRQISKQM